MICTRTQNVYIEEIENKMRGWAKPLKDKAVHNQLVHMLTINIPDFVKYYKEPGVDAEGNLKAVAPCSSFAYGAYLAPGLHQLLIYIPERIIKIDDQLYGAPAPSAGHKGAMVISARLFCKHIIVNLSQGDYVLSPPSLETSAKTKTISNVFRKWRVDSSEDINLAVKNDVKSADF